MSKISSYGLDDLSVPAELKECWDALEKMKWDYVNGEKLPTGYRSTQWSHLQDALDNGTVTKMECYNAIKLGYCPEHLTVRKSRYAHLL